MLVTTKAREEGAEHVHYRSRLSPSFQQIAFLNKETGECGEQRLEHSDGEVEKFYRCVQSQGVPTRVGIEATGYARWFERLLAELGIELWIGDAAEIRTLRVRKRKTDREDAKLLLKLLVEDRFPRVWVPNPENRDLRQLLWHRHRLVQMRTRILNQLQAVAMNEGQRWKKRLWNKQGRALLENLPLAPWASRRRQDLSELLDRFNPVIAELTTAVEREANKRPEVLRLMTHPGVGPLTALAFVLIIGDPFRLLVASRSGVMWGSSHAKTPARAGNDWDTSASKATSCCAFCWWKPRKWRCASIPTGGAAICTWRCAEIAASRKWPWDANLPFACSGCGAKVGTIRS